MFFSWYSSGSSGAPTATTNTQKGFPRHCRPYCQSISGSRVKAQTAAGVSKSMSTRHGVMVPVRGRHIPGAGLLPKVHWPIQRQDTTVPGALIVLSVIDLVFLQNCLHHQQPVSCKYDQLGRSRPFSSAFFPGLVFLFRCGHNMRGLQCTKYALWKPATAPRPHHFLVARPTIVFFGPDLPLAIDTIPKYSVLRTLRSTP
jgi:hypothetical protein